MEALLAAEVVPAGGADIGSGDEDALIEAVTGDVLPAAADAHQFADHGETAAEGGGALHVVVDHADGHFVNGDAEVAAGDEQFAIEAEALAADVGKHGGDGGGAEALEAGLRIAVADVQECAGDVGEERALEFALAEIVFHAGAVEDFAFGMGAAGDDDIVTGGELIGGGFDHVERIGEVDIGEDAVIAVGAEESAANGVALAAVAGGAQDADIFAGFFGEVEEGLIGAVAAAVADEEDFPAAGGGIEEALDFSPGAVRDRAGVVGRQNEAVERRFQAFHRNSENEASHARQWLGVALEMIPSSRSSRKTGGGGLRVYVRIVGDGAGAGEGLTRYGLWAMG